MKLAQDSKKLPKRVSPQKSAAHKQKRALLTRLQLVAAAREVFAKEGFELARIEDIAAIAGKTRGAFYDNFCDKEDVFFAIFEEDLAQDQERIRSALARSSTFAEKVKVLTDFLAELLHDRQRLLLNLEFKMYVIRHQHQQKRLASLHSEMCQRCSMTHINTLLPELSKEDLKKRNNLATELGAVVDGLALNSFFNPDGISEQHRRRYLRLAVEEAIRAIREP